MSRSFMWLITSGAVLLAGMVLLTFFGGQRNGTTVAGPGTGGPLPVLREVGPFALTNQVGKPVLREELLGRPWAANLIFTRCPGPCAQLSGVMRSIQAALPSTSTARLVSLTSDPEYDSPAVLANYAHKHGTDPERWFFVTGSKRDIRRLATEDLMLVLQEKPAESRESEDDLFLHSTLIIVVDERGRVRTAIEGLEPGAATKVLEVLSRLGMKDRE